MSRPPSEVIPFSLKTSILRAGAGAGKTTTLISLFEDVASRFKQEKGRYPKIVLTTFTRKATQELRERLLSNSLKNNNRDLFKYINQRSRVHISTIHGVLSLFLMQYGKEIGLAPEFQVMKASEVYLREKRILRQLLLSHSDWLEIVEEYDIRTLLEMLNAYYQRQFMFEDLSAVTCDEMKVLEKRILAKMVTQGQLLAEEILAYDLTESWQNFVSPFVSLGNFGLESASELVAFFEKLGRKPPFSSKKPPFDEELHERFDKFIKETKKLLQEDIFGPEVRQRHQNLCSKFEGLAKEFSRLNLTERLEGSSLSMSDIEGLSLRLIRKFPWTAERFSSQWDYWMIDEYQDTSPLQVELLGHLVGSSPHFVVGDPQQSIYLFRGARSDVFHAKIQDIESKSGEVQSALINYRSRAPLLEFINAYFLDKAAFSAMLPSRDEGHGEVCADILILAKNEQSKESEQLAVLRLIQEKLEAGTQAQEICVLAKNNRVLHEVARRAYDFQLPVQVHSAGGFSWRREILDILAALKFLINPYDNLNLLTLVRSPWFHVQDPELVKLMEGKNRNSSFWAHWNQKQGAVASDVLCALKYYLTLSEQVGLSETLKMIVLDRGMIDCSTHLDPSGRREANLWKFIVDFKAAEATSGFNVVQFIQNFETQARGEEDSDATPIVEPDRVNFMTIHSAKGLQFKHVIIVGFGADIRKYYGDWWMMDEATGKWTLSMRSLDQKKVTSLFGMQIIQERQAKEAEESQRLLYVAMTRARDSLALVWTENPRRGSWASEFPFLQMPGRHDLEKFTYQVRNEMSPPTRQADIERKPSVRRQPFSVVLRDGSMKDEVKLGSSRGPIAAAGIYAFLKHSKKSVLAYQLFENLRYQDTLWNNPPVEMVEVLNFLKSINDVPLKKIIKTGEADWRYAIEVQGSRVLGQIDLWSKENNEAWLVNFKTGNLKDIERTMQQLEVDAWVLRRMGYVHDSDRVHLIALFAGEEEFRHKIIAEAKQIPEPTKSLG